jgi:hypothetical protein
MIKLFDHSQILKKDETITVFRIPVVDIGYVDGKLSQGEELEILVVANIQPVNGRELLLVQEGDRFKEQYWVYAESPVFIRNFGLKVKDVQPLMVNDRVSRLGVNFQIQEVQDWGSYVRGRMMRVDIGPRRTP